MRQTSVQLQKPAEPAHESAPERDTTIYTSVMGYMDQTVVSGNQLEVNFVHAH